MLFRSAGATGTQPAPAQPGAPKPAASALAALAQPVKIMLYPIPAEDLAAIAKLLGANSTLPAEVAATLNAMAQSMPTRAQIFGGGIGGEPSKTYGTVISESQVIDDIAKGSKKGAPAGPVSTTTGGSETLDASLKKITDNVERTVEQKQVNPTPTGV